MRIGPSGVDGEARVPAATAEPGLDDIRRYVRRASISIERHEAFLDRLDAALGDGDHGANMAIGLRSVLRALDELKPGVDEPVYVGDLLRLIGHTLVSSVGGASGPLYGTAFIEAGFHLSHAGPIDLPALAEAFEVGTRALARRGRCAVADKTILDALDPAARALRAAVEEGVPTADAMRRAALASRAGMRATTPLVARRGLALRLGERSRGHQDPGATSCFLLVRAIVARDRPDRREGSRP